MDRLILTGQYFPVHQKEGGIEKFPPPLRFPLALGLGNLSAVGNISPVLVEHGHNVVRMLPRTSVLKLQIGLTNTFMRLGGGMSLV